MPQAIDIYERYQGVINWREVADAGVEYAFIKLTNGTARANPAGDDYVAGARSVGIVPGGYAYALGGSPVDEANAFLAELRRLNLLTASLLPADDFEDPSMPLNPDQRRWWISTFATTLNLQGQVPRQLVYSSGNELQQIDAGTINPAGVQLLAWDAEWGTNDGRLQPVHHYTGSVAVQQYTSHGTVPGIAGYVDEDQVDTNILTGPTPVPVPPAPTPAPIGKLPPGTLLHRGMAGPAVRILQHALNVEYPLYSHLTEDGIYGPLTEGVVREFQTRAHLAVDGIAGPHTLHALGLIA